MADNNTAETLIVALSREAYTQAMITDLPGRPTTGELARSVFATVEALGLESEIREMRRQVETIDDLDTWLREHAGRDHRIDASNRCRAFGLSLANSQNQTVLSWGLRLGNMSSKLVVGAIDEGAIREFRDMLHGMGRALLHEVSRLQRKAAREHGRKSDHWRSDLLDGIEKELAGGGDHEGHP